MKFQNYVVCVVDRAKEQSQKLDAKMRFALVSGMSTAMMAVPTMIAHAEGEVSLLEEAGAGGSNLLSGEVLTAITQGFGSLAVTATAVVSMAVIAGVSVIGLSAAAKYAMKKFRGVLSSAA